MLRARLLALAMVSFAAATLGAQKTPDRPPIDITPPVEVRPESKVDRLSGSLFGHWGLPVGAFHRNEDGGGGLGLHGAYAFDRAHIFALRVDGGYLAYGRVTGNRRVPQYDEFTGEFLGYADVNYAVRQHQMYTFDAGPEITALAGRWRPYVYAGAGLSYFASTMNVRPPTSSRDEGADRTIFSAGNFAWSTGLGLRVGSHAPREGLFDFGVRFRRNERSHYANDKALRTTPSGSVTVTPFYGSANLLTIYAGFWIGPVRMRGR